MSQKSSKYPTEGIPYDSTETKIGALVRRTGELRLRGKYSTVVRLRINGGHCRYPPPPRSAAGRSLALPIGTSVCQVPLSLGRLRNKARRGDEAPRQERTLSLRQNGEACRIRRKSGGLAETSPQSLGERNGVRSAGSFEPQKLTTQGPPRLGASAASAWPL